MPRNLDGRISMRSDAAQDGVVADLRDYQAWHADYDDPESAMSWRLQTAQRYIRLALDRYPGSMHVLSVCSGDGRDVLGVMSHRDDADRVNATLIEVHPQIAQDARDAAAAAALPNIEVRTADAGNTDAYVGAVPAELVIMIGVFGNITDDDLERTIAAAPEFCRSGATLLWSRGRDRNDRNAAVRAWFAKAGFTELDYATRDSGSRPALGAMRYDGEPRPLTPGRRLFTFWR